MTHNPTYGLRCLFYVTAFGLAVLTGLFAGVLI